MQIRLVWKATNDEVLFDVLDADVATWFVAHGQKLGKNQYRPGDQVIDQLSAKPSTLKLIQEERAYIKQVNEALASLRMPLFQEPENYLDQKQLNTLHKDWAETRQKWPKLSELFYQLNHQWYEAYQEMNCHIHLIEQSFEYRFRDVAHWRTHNPFKERFFEWQICHLYIEYPGHGRSAYEKFQCMDIYDDIGRDNCNWDNLDSFIGVKLSRPYRMDPPREFLDWCEQENLVPWGHTLPLANVADWQNNLTRARQVFTENVKIKDNYFSLETIN